MSFSELLRKRSHVKKQAMSEFVQSDKKSSQPQAIPATKKDDSKLTKTNHVKKEEIK